jgi:hypothetical protein
LLALLLAAISANRLLAQNPSSTLHGQVTDPSGAAVVGATVVVTSAAGQAATAKTNRDGNYAIKGLAPGKYAVQASAKGFADFQQQDLVIAAGQDQALDIQFTLAPQKQEVVVTDHPATVDVNPENNASALVIKGKDLDALSDDPDELQSELQALAGPSAGPNGGQIYIDGFTGGQLPPKSSIREIRINQNPFSAEYDKLGYGRIEIFTKPGTDKFHGQMLFSLNDSIFNSQNPFSSGEPPYHTLFFSGNVSGPLGKKASFFFDAERRNIGDVSVVNAIVPGNMAGPCPASVSLTVIVSGSTPCQAAIANPRTRTSISPRLDYQVSASNTLTVRYRFVQTNETNDGIGQFSLASQGYNVTNTEQVLQISDTQVISPRTVNETRFEYERDRNTQIAQTFGPTVSVLGAFTSGGNSSGNVFDNEDQYELQNYTSMSLGKHYLKFGGRLRAYRVANDTNSDFNGLFTFSQLSMYPNMPGQLQISCGPNIPHLNCNPSSAVIRLTQFDLGLYAQDDWRLRPNMTLSLGLRFETQNNIHDHADVAPRLGFAWGLGPKNAPPKTVLRLGFGVFYDRFGDSLVLNADRLNGFNQSQCVDSTPDFPMTTCTPNGNQTVSTIRQIDPNLRAPYTIQSAVSVERQISKIATVSVTYINSRGVHALLSRNINAPVPLANGTGLGPRPNPLAGNIDNYESDGVFRQNQLIANFNIRAGTKLSLFGFYSLGYADSDTAGAGSFPSDQYDISADYGRAAFDVRNRFFLGGTYSLPYGLRVSPFLVANSGAPFNVTIGDDLNGDSIFNDRPAFANGATGPNIVQTPLGAFNIAPLLNQTRIPTNFGTGPGQFTMNLRVSKTIGLGKKVESSAAGAAGAAGGGRGGPGGGGGGRGGGLGGRGLSSGGGNPFSINDSTGRRYSLTFSAAGRNIFNNVNVAPPIGVVTSPFFDHSNALAGGFFSSSSANRRVDLQVTFSF